MKKVGKVFLNIVLWFWQIIQNIAGAVAVFFSGAKPQEFKDAEGKSFKVYVTKDFMNSGVSLGNYIILDDVYTSFKVSSDYKMLTIKHEYGHQVQSKILGPLYLIVIGIPSALGNIFDRMFYVGKKSQEEREKWYYNLPWEKWADKLCGAYEMRQRYFEEYSIYGSANKGSGAFYKHSGN